MEFNPALIPGFERLGRLRRKELEDRIYQHNDVYVDCNGCQKREEVPENLKWYSKMWRWGKKLLAEIFFCFLKISYKQYLIRSYKFMLTIVFFFYNDEKWHSKMWRWEKLLAREPIMGSPIQWSLLLAVIFCCFLKICKKLLCPVEIILTIVFFFFIDSIAITIREILIFAVVKVVVILAHDVMINKQLPVGTSFIQGGIEEAVMQLLINLLVSIFCNKSIKKILTTLHHKNFNFTVSENYSAFRAYCI